MGEEGGRGMPPLLRVLGAPPRPHPSASPSPFYAACHYGSVDCVAYLASTPNLVDLNSRNTKVQCTPVRIWEVRVPPRIGRNP